MSTYGPGSFDIPEMEPSSAEIQQLMTEKAHELFNVCDTEKKGFIAKRDMQRLQSELPLSPEQLEHVFDSLDDDGNGFLTLEEFTDGFGSFLGLKSSPEETGEMAETYADDQHDPVEDEHNFRQMMENVGATKLYEDESTMQSLWCRLRKEDPDMAGNFEHFLYKVSNEIRKSKVDFDTLEGALRSKTSAHDEEVRKLYEEMETQIKTEKDKILGEERAKERQLREAMEKDVQEKDRQLQELLSKHSEMEERLGNLNTVEVETKIENEKLAKEKDELEESLLQSEKGLEESKSYISQLRQQQKDEKRDRARAALKLSEGIALERETLVKQLDLLKNMNKKLLDDKDEAETRRLEDASPRKETPRKGELERQGSVLGKYFDTKRIPRLSSCSQSISEDVAEDDNNARHGLTETDIDDGIECDDDIYIDGQAPSFIHNTVSTMQYRKGNDTRTMQVSPNRHYREAESRNPGEEIMNNKAELSSHGDGQTQNGELQWQGQDPLSVGAGQNWKGGDTLSQGAESKWNREGSNMEHENQIGFKSSETTTSQTQRGVALTQRGTIAATLQRGDNVNSSVTSMKDNSYSNTAPPRFDQVAYTTSAAAVFARPKFNSESSSYTPDSPRVQPVGADEMTDSGIQDSIAPTPLQRIFKVVFVGDSGVGKSSFIHRFCTNHFKQSYAATIGVDFQIKSIVIEGTVIVLQVWDTAGQERFRSITKQYFRKADGVIIMYDVTSEATFTNVRNWMTSVQDGASDDAITVLLGNKNDLPEEDDVKAVKMKDGSRLADEYDSLFYETSALSGDNVVNSMEALARILKEKEDKDIEKSFRLEEMETKKGCCGK